MTHLRKMMLEELQRRNYSQIPYEPTSTLSRSSREYFRQAARPARAGAHPAAIRLYLFRERKLAAGTVEQHVAALRFFFVKTLKRPYMLEYIPYPKTPAAAADRLSQEEVARLIDAASNLMHRAILMTLYSTGMRRAELCHLKVSDIDSERMVIHIRQGKGSRDRDVPLSPKLLETLREYWRWMKPKTYLFPGTVNNWRADVPITDKVVWHACRKPPSAPASTSASTRILLRHSFATHLLEAGADLRTIQFCWGTPNSKHTVMYLHLSQRHLQAVANPLDSMAVSDRSGNRSVRDARKKR